MIEVDMDIPAKQNGNEKGSFGALFDLSNATDFVKVMNGSKKKATNKKKMKVSQARPILEVGS